MSTAPQQYPQQPQQPSADDVLFGSGVKAAQLEVGREVGGPIVGHGTHPERDYDPLNPGRGPVKHYPSGEVIHGVHVDVQTAQRESATDDGVRRIYVDGQRFKEAVRNAIAATGQRGFEVGAHLYVTKTGKEPTGTAGLDANTYSARYIAAASAALMGPQQQQQPAQQPQWPAQPQGPAPDFAQPQQQQPQQQGGLDQFAPQQQQPQQQYTPEQIAAFRAAGIPGW
jgi:hypothetical protein